MSGLFDSIIDSISDFDSWGKSALGSAYTEFSKSSAANKASQAKGINEGVSSMSMTQRYDSSKSRPAEVPSPDDLERMWYNRLNKFAALQSTVSKPR